jgi:hypothetical protein
MNCQPHRAGSHGGGSAAKAVSDPVTSAPDDVVHAPPPAPLRPDFRATVGTSTRIPAHGRKCHDGGNSRCLNVLAVRLAMLAAQRTDAHEDSIC